MQLRFESVLLLYRGNDNKTFACRVKCRSSSKKAKKTLRILTVQQWQVFDNCVEEFLCSDKVVKGNSKFYLKDFDVEIKKSNVHFHSLKECLGNREISGINDTSYIWDCCIVTKDDDLSKDDHKNDLEYQPLAINCSSETLPNITYKPSKVEELDLKDDIYQPISLNSTNSDEIASPEYKPSPIKSKGNKKTKQLADTDDIISESDHETTSNALYKPWRIKRKIKCTKEYLYEYIPSSQEGNEIRQTPVPEYIPTPIKITSANEKSNQKPTPANVYIKDCKKPLKEQFPRLEYRANEIDDANSTKEETTKLNNSTSLSPCDSKNFSDVDVNLDSSVESEKCKCELKDVAPLRRSARSSVKTQRLIEHLDNVKGAKRKKLKARHNELFGSDDEEEATNSYVANDDDSTKNNKYIISSTKSMIKNKGRKEQSIGCEQEKRSMHNWLSKQTSPLNLPSSSTTYKCCRIKSIKNKNKKKKIQKSTAAKDSSEFFRTKSETDSMQQLVNSKHEQALQERERLNQIQPPPIKVTTDLSLKGMNLDEVMSTFEQYRSYLDDIYQECYKKNHIKTFNGLNHCLVINLIEERVQSKMLQMISNVYSGSKNHPTMFGNAMLPEWLIRIFMDKHKFTRAEAIEQITMQEANKLDGDGDGDENTKDRLLNFDIE